MKPYIYRSRKPQHMLMNSRFFMVPSPMWIILDQNGNEVWAHSWEAAMRWLFPKGSKNQYDAR